MASERGLDGGPRDARGGTAGRILDAAEARFAVRGFSGTSIRDIAADVGVNPASIYNHFPGKQELYEAVLDRGLHPIFELLGEILDSRRSVDGDQRVIDALVDHFARNPNFVRLLHHEALAGGDSIARLGARWLEPIYARGLTALSTAPGARSGAGADPPLLVLALHNLVLCYFSMAPLFEKLLGRDLLSPEMIARQKLFLGYAIRRLVSSAA